MSFLRAEGSRMDARAHVAMVWSDSLQRVHTVPWLLACRIKVAWWSPGCRVVQSRVLPLSKAACSLNRRSYAAHPSPPARRASRIIRRAYVSCWRVRGSVVATAMYAKKQYIHVDMDFTSRSLALEVDLSDWNASSCFKRCLGVVLASRRKLPSRSSPPASPGPGETVRTRGAVLAPWRWKLRLFGGVRAVATLLGCHCLPL